MAQSTLRKAATEYAKKALKTSEGKDPSPAKLKKTVNELVRKFAPIVANCTGWTSGQKLLSCSFSRTIQHAYEAGLSGAEIQDVLKGADVCITLVAYQQSKNVSNPSWPDFPKPNSD